MLEGREPRRFDEARNAQGGLHRKNRGVEAFQMAHLQNTFRARRDLDEVLAFGDGHRHGLFDQYVRAGFEKRLGHFKMRGGGRDDAHGIDFAQKIPVILRAPRLEVPRPAPRAPWPTDRRYRPAENSAGWRIFAREIGPDSRRRSPPCESRRGVPPPLAVGAVLLTHLQGRAAHDCEGDAAQTHQSSPQGPLSRRQRPKHRADAQNRAHAQ